MLFHNRVCPRGVKSFGDRKGHATTPTGAEARSGQLCFHSRTGHSDIFAVSHLHDVRKLRHIAQKYRLVG